MKQVSVIIPNYNSEKYIKRCLDALLNQEYKVDEIIVVDDCSTDKSKEIIKQYTEKYDNIFLEENKTNKGVSFSRNKGIEIAKSEYIVFCDPDDWYEKDAIKKMMEYKTRYDADYVVAGYYMTHNSEKRIEIKYNGLFRDTVVDKDICISYMPITSSAKLIKKSIFTEHNLKYPEGIKNCEELPVIPVAAYWANKVVYMDECIYNYYQRENSASNNKLEDLSFYDITYNQFCQSILNANKEAVLQRMVEHLLYSKTYSLVKNNYSNKEIIENIEKCKTNLEGQNVKTILKRFPLRKRMFLRCALMKVIFPLKLYIKIQEKLLKE